MNQCTQFVCVHVCTWVAKVMHVRERVYVMLKLGVGGVGLHILVSC